MGPGVLIKDGEHVSKCYLTYGFLVFKVNLFPFAQYQY